MQHNLKTYSFPLGAGKQCPSGTFHLDLASGRCDWSDGLFAIHGYARGEVVPTEALIMAHKHPEDRGPVRELLNEIRSSGGQGALFHRIIDCQGREHRVLTLAQACEGHGPVTAIQGVVMDLTRTVAAEASREAAAAVAGAYANKATIEQAKGIIMGRLDVPANEAFTILAARSQHTNTKLAAVAAELVDAAGQGKVTAALQRWGISEPAGTRIWS
ncbi:PAS and ANTAR domain-containing protein [Arthrobacter sp. ISL-5]|uniref:PAS and ANTAR domain-containing protein n=1 Tax=Arthrobacter sp. ISL-5 TaxID=2819111 RepID=UPI001BE6994F|nr:PAS and ANTAR domain-containing protein [Arthrobacter sp. ISL-5]MBT2551483.1 PAS and ANTAR domain-containing protein [Arthrobacter sp. ISL-5]